MLDDIPKSCPPLTKANKIQKKVAKVGFEYQNHFEAIDKIIEEANELKKEIKNKDNKRIKEELGDLIFSTLDVSRKLNLRTEIFQENIFDIKNLKTGTIMSRAFKPMPVVLDLVYENFLDYKNLIFFVGRSGKKVFKNLLKDWDLEYTERKSLTSEDSFLLNIKKIRKIKIYKKN